jgi:KTSC domain
MSRPQMHRVDSTCVAKLGYDPPTEELYVEFHDSPLYRYRGVPRAVFAEFVAAGSKGTRS